MRRFLICASFVVFVFLFAVGCSSEPSEVDSVPTLPSTTSNLKPTPTLIPGIPTPPLPTPPITPTAVADQSEEELASEDPEISSLELSERLDLGRSALIEGNYARAIKLFSSALREEPSLKPDAQADTLYELGTAYLAEGELGDAATMFNQHLGLAGDDARSSAHFHIAQASAALGDFETAVEQYQIYVDANPEMAAYVYPLIAEAYLASGDSTAALVAYESALSGPAHRLKEYANRQILAKYYINNGDFESAIAQYDAITDFAKTDATRGQMTYLAGVAELFAGNTDEAYKRFLDGVTDYPGVYESYLGLVELVKAEVPVDDYQRGLVDYNAAAYAPGIPAFEAHIAANPEDYKPDAHRYLALSYEALADSESAFKELDKYAEFEPAAALFEKAEIQSRAGDTEAAIESFQLFLEEHPDEDSAPLAAWQNAALIEQLGDIESALEQFQMLADKYPDHEDAPEALYHAGWLAQSAEDTETAYKIWQRAAEEYTESQFGSAALVRLLRAEQDLDEDQLASLQELALNNPNASFPALRAGDLAAGIEPFSSEKPFKLPVSSMSAQKEAERWLLDQLDMTQDEIDGPVSELGPDLAEDNRLQLGEKLWELRLFEEAKLELEDLRSEKSDSLLDSYRLALFLRDLGLYRSSIIAGTSILDLAGQSVLEAPSFIGQLAYPAYYADHIVPLAEEYDYDPRLQFSLVRQESLFESIARSGAAAQGLSQVIPDTGAWIAERLQWPDYDNEDLYKPYVGLEFGAYYLAQQLDAFDGDIHAALAAYNAGPGNATRWYELAGSDIDQFIDVMDFWETRTYIERIYAGYDIYRHLYE